MAQLYLAFHGGLAILRPQNNGWTAAIELIGQDCHCLAVDPHRPQRV
jgi:hypothetical protein